MGIECQSEMMKKFWRCILVNVANNVNVLNAT